MNWQLCWKRWVAMTVALPPWRRNISEALWLPWQRQSSGDDYKQILYSWFCGKGNGWIRCEQKKWLNTTVTMPTRGDECSSSCKKLCVYLCVLARAVLQYAVWRRTEGDVTQPRTQTKSTRNKQNIHTSGEIPVFFLFLVSRKAEKRRNRCTDLESLYRMEEWSRIKKGKLNWLQTNRGS